MRTTRVLIGHLKLRHNIDENSLHPGPCERPSKEDRSLETESPAACDSDDSIEERPPAVDCTSLVVTQPGNALQSTIVRPRSKPKQTRVTTFLDAKHTLRKDALRLICEDNLCINRVALSKTLRRLLQKSYPSDPPPPRSPSTYRKYLSEDASMIRSELQNKFGYLRSNGSYVSR